VTAGEWIASAIFTETFCLLAGDRRAGSAPR